MIHQLFRKEPPYEVCLQVLQAFGLWSFYDCRYFTRKNIERECTVQKLIEMQPMLCEYYLPCKARAYLSNLNAKNAVTVLRHFARVNNCRVSSSEKYHKGEKYIVYVILRNDGCTGTANFPSSTTELAGRGGGLDRSASSTHLSDDSMLQRSTKFATAADQALDNESVAAAADSPNEVPAAAKDKDSAAVRRPPRVLLTFD